MNDSPIIALVRGWVDLYTRGLPAELRAARRDEVNDDLWCQHEEAKAMRRSTASLNAEVLMRWVFGVPADLSWRLASGRIAQRRAPERISSMSTRLFGAWAILAGLSWTAMIAFYMALGGSAWAPPFGGVTVLCTVSGGLAFAATGFGLLWRFQEQLHYGGVIGATTAGLGGIAAAFDGGWAISLLPIGSAGLAWDLARFGALPRTLAIMHVVTSLGLLIPITGAVAVASTTGIGLIGFAVPYPLSWIAIGVSLVRGVPTAPERAISA